MASTTADVGRRPPQSSPPVRATPRTAWGWLRGHAGTALVLVVLAAVLPTVVAAVRSMGVSQWVAAVALGLIFVPVAIGVYLTFRVLDFPDLTVDASFPAGGAIAATLILHGHSPWFSLPAAAALGAVLGAATALLSVLLRVNSLLASIITLTASFTVSLRIQGSSNLSLIGVDRIFTPFAVPVRDRLTQWFGETGGQIHRGVVTGLVTLGLVAVLVVLLGWFFRTEVGLAMRAMGANVEMSRSQAIGTSAYLVAGVALSNALIAVAGALFVQHEGFADVNSGAGLIVAGLAAVIIGEVLFGRGSTSIVRMVVAAALGMIVYRLIIAIALNTTLRLPGLEPIALESTDIKMATALVVVGMLAVPRLRETHAERRRRRAR